MSVCYSTTKQAVRLEAIPTIHSIKCAMVKSRYIGDGHPTFNRNPYNGYKTPTIGLMTIPYYMEIMGV